MLVPLCACCDRAELIDASGVEELAMMKPVKSESERDSDRDENK